MKLTLGFSPCPNDTFIFDALVHKKIDTEGFGFEVVMADVEELNQKAFQKVLDITKLSYHAMGYLLDSYILLNSGSALGQNCGPLLVKKSDTTISDKDLSNIKIAIPGKYTTANFLLSLAYPNANNKIELLFSEIENAVLNNNVDAGLLIHENRFTYKERGLEKIVDLGAFWENMSNAPIPLGGIAIKRSFSEEIQRKIERLIRKSIEFAFNNRNESKEFIRCNAQEMDEKVMQNHIDLYVNEYSIDLGERGRNAVELMFREARKIGVIPENKNQIFVK